MDLPDASVRQLGDIYITEWVPRIWWIVQVTNPRDKSITPIAGPYDRRPEIALRVTVA